MSETTTTGDKVTYACGECNGTVELGAGVTKFAYHVDAAEGAACQDIRGDRPIPVVARTYPCPGCGVAVEPTLDENGGNYRHRCEACDTEQCAYCGPGVWVHYFRDADPEGWAHVDDRTCFQNGPAPSEFPPEVSAGRLLTALGEVIGDRSAFVEQTGGGVATIYVGEADENGRYELAIGPGSYNWSVPGDSVFALSELYVGPDDDGETTPATVRNLAQVAYAARHHLGIPAPAETAVDEAPEVSTVRVPGRIVATYKDGRITRLTFDPGMDPEAHLWEGDEGIDLVAHDGEFWRAMQAALTTKRWVSVRDGNVVDSAPVENHAMLIEWVE